jgi:regulator of sigma E protease
MKKEIKVPVIVSADGKLGIGIGRLEMESLEKLGYYKVSKQEFSLIRINSRIKKGKDQLVGYGKQLKMIFSPSTGAYKQRGFKAIFDIFPKHGAGKFSGTLALLSIMLGVMNLYLFLRLMVVT